MGSPTITSPTESPSKAMDTVEASLDARQRTRQRSKLFGNDSPYHYGNNCASYHAPRVPLPPSPIYAVPYYAYHQSPIHETLMFPRQLYYPVSHRDVNGGVHQLESHVLRMSLVDDSKTRAKYVDAPPVPPSTPSSTSTDISSPMSSPSAHRARSESSHAGEEVQAPRQRANSGGSFYRTKPCKFFHEKGLCVKGNRCNFIHEQHQARRRSTSESEPQPPDVDGSSPSRRRRAAKQIQMIKAEDADKRSNFYPITWRVIGGGVMMSGHREACNDFLRGECALGSDCKFAHPVEDDDDFSDASSYADLPEPYSPVSPLCLSPYYPYQPIPIFATAVNELVAPEPVKIIEPPRSVFAPVVLDGNTLLPRTEPVTSEYDEQKVPVEADTNLPAAREIPRPVSTPPVPNGSSVSDMKSLRLFQAEMP